MKLLGRFARGGTRAPRAFILRYHRVAALRSDPNRLAIEPERFAEHVALLAARWKPRPLPVLADELARDELLDGAVAVTFDDGYLDVLLTARPALERHGVPATIFLVADMLAATREFWWDELERVCFGSSGPRPALDLLVGDKRIVSDGAEPSRPLLFRRLHPLLKSLPAVERDRALARLLEWAGVDRAPRLTHRLIGRSDLTGLAGDPLLTVGAHTRSHPLLSRLGPNEQRAEIAGSKQVLESVLGAAVTSFAYPFGAGRRAARLVAEAGFRAAVTTVDAPVRPGADPFLLPRIDASGLDPEALARRLESRT